MLIIVTKTKNISCSIKPTIEKKIKLKIYKNLPLTTYLLLFDSNGAQTKTKDTP